MAEAEFWHVSVDKTNTILSKQGKEQIQKLINSHSKLLPTEHATI